MCDNSQLVGCADQCLWPVPAWQIRKGLDPICRRSFCIKHSHMEVAHFISDLPIRYQSAGGEGMVQEPRRYVGDERTESSDGSNYGVLRPWTRARSQRYNTLGDLRRGTNISLWTRQHVPLLVERKWGGHHWWGMGRPCFMVKF